MPGEIISTFVCLAMILVGAQAASISSLPNIVMGTVGESVTIKATLFNATNSTLSWMNGDIYLVNVTVSSYMKKASVETPHSLNSTLFIGSFAANGSDVNTNLTLNNLQMSMNRSQIMLKDRNVESPTVATLIIKEPPTTTTTIASTTDTVTSESMTSSVSMTSPDTITTSSPTPSTSSNDVTPTTSTTSTTTTTESSGIVCPSSGPDAPPGGTTCVQPRCVVTLTDQNSINAYKGSGRLCSHTYTCNATGSWNMVESDCKCSQPGTWGPDCTNTCGYGCTAVNGTISCDIVTGKCSTYASLEDDCTEGYKGRLCNQPICGDCNGGECLVPGFCGNCPKHFEHGPTCRNISLDGFVKGSLPSLAILGVVVILLSIVSRWHIRRKIKEA